VYLTSVLKRIDNAVFSAAADVYGGSFTNDLYVGTLENEGVGIAPFHDQADRVSDELQAELDELRQAIIDGTVSVSG
jgi:basic membrane protein A